ncbi:MAG: co-chaperone GroES [Opitutales bacterium]|jgi:chaperonin GroES
MKIKPLGERVLTKRIEEDEQIRGGIIIPDSAKEKSQEAEVVALGTGKADDKPFHVKVGDKVLLPTYGGSQVKIDGVEYTLINEEDILGVVA